MGAARRLALLGGRGARSGRRSGGAGTRRRARTRSASGSRRRTRSSPASACARSSSRRPGERLLEVGPGTGYYALPVAEWLAPGGTLDVLDVQQEMLDHTLRRAGEHGIDNITPTLADARELPYRGRQLRRRVSRDRARGDPGPGRRAARAAARGEARGPHRGRRAVRRPAHGHPLGACASAPRRPGCAWSASSAARSGTSRGCKPDCSLEGVPSEAAPSMGPTPCCTPS